MNEEEKSRKIREGLISQLESGLDIATKLRAEGYHSDYESQVKTVRETLDCAGNYLSPEEMKHFTGRCDGLTFKLFEDEQYHLK